MSTAAQAHITFGIRGEALDPQQVSAWLALQPSHCFAKGDWYESKAGKRQRPFGVWQLRSESEVRSLDLEDHAYFILTRLEPVQKRLARYLEDPTCYVEIRIWWEFPSETGGYCLRSDTLRRLALLCNEFNFTYIATCAVAESE